MDDRFRILQSDRLRTLSRRSLLRNAAALSGAFLLAACGQGATSQPGAAPAGPPTGATEPAAGAATAAPAAGPPTGATEPAAGAATSAPAVAITEPLTLRVWGYGLDDTRAQARVAEFTKQNPNITIEPVGGELNTQQLLTAVASGDPPEVVNVDRVQTGSWAGRNAIDPLDDLISRDGFDLAQFYPFLIDQVKYKDKVFGVPQFVNIDLLYINLDVLKEAGIDPASVDTGNWQQMQDMGAKLAKVNGETIERTGFDTKAQDGRLWYWAWANGVDLITPDGTKAQFNDPKVVEALTWAKETVDKQGGEKARAAFQQTQNFFSPQNPILIGQIAMTLYEQWLIGVMKVNPQANFTTQLPRKRNSQEGLTMASGTAFAIPKGIKDQAREAAWAFIKGMTSTEAWIAGEKATAAGNQEKGEKYHPTITGNIKADQEAWANIYTGIGPGYDATVKLFPEALKSAKFPYSGPVAAQISDFTKANINDALQGVRTPQDALDDLQTKAQQAIDDFAKGPGVR